MAAGALSTGASDVSINENKLQAMATSIWGPGVCFWKRWCSGCIWSLQKGASGGVFLSIHWNNKKMPQLYLDMVVKRTHSPYVREDGGVKVFTVPPLRGSGVESEPVCRSRSILRSSLSAIVASTNMNTVGSNRAISLNPSFMFIPQYKTFPVTNMSALNLKGMLSWASGEGEMQSFCEQADEDDLAIPSHHSPLKPSGACSFQKEKKKDIWQLWWQRTPKGEEGVVGGVWKFADVWKQIKSGVALQLSSNLMVDLSKCIWSFQPARRSVRLHTRFCRRYGQSSFD